MESASISRADSSANVKLDSRGNSARVVGSFDKRFDMLYMFVFQVQIYVV